MQKGWVRRDRIEIGDAIVREDVLFDVAVADDDAQLQYIPVDVNVRESVPQVQRAVSGLLTMINTCKDDIFGGLPDWCNKLFQNIPKLTDDIVKAMKDAGVYDVLNEKDFDFKQLYTAGRQISGDTPQGLQGIYARFYWGVPEMPGAV